MIIYQSIWISVLILVVYHHNCTAIESSNIFFFSIVFLFFLYQIKFLQYPSGRMQSVNIQRLYLPNIEAN